mmetsp:Transcript_30973/g.82289  ORF Transcript_30973/g.82289 Transcript_30973/m.82289 type:complete len:224 (+) Transcript_30973:4105-4776(+)
MHVSLHEIIEVRLNRRRHRNDPDSNDNDDDQQRHTRSTARVAARPKRNDELNGVKAVKNPTDVSAILSRPRPTILRRRNGHFITRFLILVRSVMTLRRKRLWTSIIWPPALRLSLCSYHVPVSTIAIAISIIIYIVSASVIQVRLSMAVFNHFSRKGRLRNGRSWSASRRRRHGILLVRLGWWEDDVVGVDNARSPILVSGGRSADLRGRRRQHDLPVFHAPR